MNSEKTVAIFNMEMGAEQLATRMLSSVGQIEGYKLRSGKLENSDWKRVNEAISRLADTKMYVDDTPGMTISEIRAKCRRLASSDEGLGIVIIDYLQLINGTARYAGNRQQEVSEISRSLKMLAMELGIPVIALAQLSRTVDAREDKRPILSDLRESGSIEQDADIVAFLYRDDYYNKENEVDDYTSRSEFIISKHRNGPTATIDLIFKRNTSTFVNFINKEE
jgi:replicative DNA helicase